MTGGGAGTARARVRLVITGRVQGVAFRYHARDEAHRLGLQGWIRNRADGSVEAVAEGERGHVEAFLAWCRRGPPLAQVDDVDVVPEPPRGDLRAFDIAR